MWRVGYKCLDDKFVNMNVRTEQLLLRELNNSSSNNFLTSSNRQLYEYTAREDGAVSSASLRFCDDDRGEVHVETIRVHLQRRLSSGDVVGNPNDDAAFESLVSKRLAQALANER